MPTGSGGGNGDGKKGREWGCTCGFASNWPSKAACYKCGRRAPQHILDRQRDELKNKGKQQKQQPGANKSLENEVAELRSQLAALKKERAGTPNANQQCEGKDELSIADLLAEQKRLRDILPEGDEILVAWAAKIQKARDLRNEAKPASLQLKDAEAFLARKTKAVHATQEKLAKARDEVALLEAESRTRQAEAAEAEKQVLTLRAASVVDMGPSLEVLLDSWQSNFVLPDAAKPMVDQLLALAKQAVPKAASVPAAAPVPAASAAAAPIGGTQVDGAGVAFVPPRVDRTGGGDTCPEDFEQLSAEARAAFARDSGLETEEAQKRAWTAVVSRHRKRSRSRSRR
jgi:ribosomal protein L9